MESVELGKAGREESRMRDGKAMSRSWGKEGGLGVCGWR